jgi:hypothetical protein
LALKVLVGLFAIPQQAHAIWVVNFGPAKTLPRGRVGFAAGMGGQAVFVGDPLQANAFFFIPHAGLRVGLAERVDIGWRLAPVPLPFATVGPGFGANIDTKVHVTPADSKVQLSLIGGIGLAHVLVLNEHRIAWSPNGAALVSFHLNDTITLTTMGRYVYLAIPTAPGGSASNFVHIAGPSLGLKIDVLPRVSVLPEIGGYWYEGRMNDVRTSGPGFQYGVMLATSF